MATPKIRQFAGDIRLWAIGQSGVRTPVIPEPTDPSGNQPIEANTTIFGYEAGDEQIVRSKRRGGRYQQPIRSDQLPGTTNVTIELLEAPGPILACMLYGDDVFTAVGAGSVTDAAFTVVRADVPAQLPHRLLAASPAPVVKKGASTLVAGTDYVIDLRRGQLIAKSSEITDGTALEVSYTYPAQNVLAITGGTRPTKSFYITGDMEDRISGSDGELRIPELQATVDGDVDWLSEQPITVTLTGNCIVPAGESAPYTFVEYAEAT